MLSRSLLLLFFIWSSVACNPTKPVKNAVDTGKTLNKDSRPSEENVGIPGYIVRCKEELLNDRQRNIQCGMATEAGNFVDFDTDVKTSRHSINSEYSDAYSEYETNDARYPLGIELNATKYPDVAVFSIYLSTSISFSAEFKDGRPAAKATNTIAEGVTKSDPILFSYYRIHIDSIEASLFDDASACLSNLTFYERGAPLVNSISPANEESVGGYPVITDASTWVDPSVSPLHALLGEPAFWESNLDVFSNQAPFDAVSDTWYQIQFLGTAPDIGAIRVSTHIADYPLGECIPDKLRILGSNDGVTWIEVSRVELELPSALDYIYIKWK